MQIADGQVLINGEELTKDIYVSDIEYAGEAEQPVELGDDEYFVIGDNHDASDDSRLPSIGAVTRDEIYGKRGLSSARAGILDLSADSRDDLHRSGR